MRDLIKKLNLKRAEVKELVERLKVIDKDWTVNLGKWQKATNELFDLGAEFTKLTKEAPNDSTN